MYHMFITLIIHQHCIKCFLKYRYISNKCNIMKNVNIVCHSFQKVTCYIYSLQIELNISSIYFLINVDDYGLQIMQTQNSVSQKIRILHKITTKGYFKQKCQSSEKYVRLYEPNPAGK